MHTDLQFVLEFSHAPDGIKINLKDRHGFLIDLHNSIQPRVELNFKVLLPNKLIFTLENPYPTTRFVNLKKCCLGGLELPPSIMNQICSFTRYQNNQNSITTHWDSDGEVIIDFFAADWVQYHLLYNNKINFNKT